MTTAAEWQAVVGRTWADLAHWTDRAFGNLTPHLLARIAELPGGEVYDIGCGAGELAIAVARARPKASVTGCDISADLADVARVRAYGVDNLRIVLGDAGSIVPADAPDLLMSRHGVMFFDNPVLAFSHLAAVAQPGARLIFSCFRGQEENEWARAIAQILPVPPHLPDAPLYVPGPFAFRDPALVGDILASSGWTQAAFQPVDFSYLAGRGDEALGEAVAFFARIGPFAAAMRAADGTARDKMRQRLGEELRNWHRGGEIAFPAAAWIVSARRG